MEQIFDIEVITTCRRVVRVSDQSNVGMFRKDLIRKAIEIAQEEITENSVIGTEARIIK